MRFPIFSRTFWKKFWPLAVLLAVLILGGVWYRFLGPGEFSARALKAYNTAFAAVLELRRNPNNFSAAMRAGVGYYNLSLMNKSAEYYLKATDIDPMAALPWNNLGNAYRELLRYQDAESAYKRSIELQPELPTSYLNLANLYTLWPEDEANKRPLVLPTLLAALDATKRDVRVLQSLADYYNSQGNSDQADKYLQEIQLHYSEDANPPKRS